MPTNEARPKIFPFEGKARHNLLTYSAGAALNDTGEEMYAPYLSYYAGNMLGVTPEQYGLIEGVAEAVNRILRGFTGRLSDNWGRKPPVVLGYILIALSRLGLCLVKGWAGFIPVRGLRQVGRSLRDPAREASLAESVPLPQRGRAFGFLNMVDTFGAILGPLIGLFILSSVSAGYLTIKFIPDEESNFSRTAYLWLFMWASIPTIITGWIIWGFLKETRTKEISKTAPSLYKAPHLLEGIMAEFKRTATDVRDYFAHKQLGNITISHMVLAISAVPMQMILFYVYSTKDGLSGTPIQGAILFIAYSVIHFISSYPAGILVDKLGRFRSQLTANIMCIINLFLIAVIRSPLLMLIPFIIYGIFDSLWLTARRSIIADLAPAQARGQTLGTFSMLYGLTSLLSPILVGFIWHHTTPAVAFVTMGLIGIGATVILISAQRK